MCTTLNDGAMVQYVISLQSLNLTFVRTPVVDFPFRWILSVIANNKSKFVDKMMQFVDAEFFLNKNSIWISDATIFILDIILNVKR